MSHSGKKTHANDQNWGTLACWLTKYKALMWQIENNIPYLCFIEDDLLISNTFTDFCHSQLTYLNDFTFARLGKWGEGYITSLAAAKNIVNELFTTGIKYPIDIQLRLMKSCKEIILADTTPWKLLINPTAGQRTKTEKITTLNY